MSSIQFIQTSMYIMHASRIWCQVAQGMSRRQAHGKLTPLLLPLETRLTPVRRHHFLAAAILFLSLIARPVHADTIDDFIKRQIKKRHIPGLSLAILKD